MTDLELLGCADLGLVELGNELLLCFVFEEDEVGFEFTEVEEFE